ncbi:ClbS/DfsB family four-helix bundle protein [Lactiplantibacillus plantarum]|uniref:ClbS/DfsB family four-helix bundle protein n=1 Tax=Lactiplantibacillus plantarum TaxID=1590 RepID=UPI003D35C268
MRTYANPEELITQIKSSYTKFIAEFDVIPNQQRDLLVDNVDKSPSQMLAYQIGWLTLLLSWESDEKQGKTVVTPAPKYKWNNLGGLYQQFYQEYGQQTLDSQRKQLDQLVIQVCQWLSTLNQTEFLGVGQRQWANNQAQWPIWKWIHINTVAPFTNFRPKIRKWKKLAAHS